MYVCMYICVHIGIYIGIGIYIPLRQLRGASVQAHDDPLLLGLWVAQPAYFVLEMPHAPAGL